MKYTIGSFEEEFGINPYHVADLLYSMKDGVSFRFKGICHNLSKLIEDRYSLGGEAYNIIMNLSIGWKYHTGSNMHPVPFPKYINSDLWTGKQLEYRLDLIDYIIGQLKEIK